MIGVSKALINLALKQICKKIQREVMASYIRILKELVYKWERAAPSPFRGPRPTVPLNSTGTRDGYR